MKTKNLEEFLKEHEYFEAFCKNCYLYPMYDINDVFSPACSIYTAFSWVKTPEGAHFWNNLHNEAHRFNIKYQQNLGYFYKIGETLVNQNNTKETQINSELPQEPFNLQKAVELMLQGHKVSLKGEDGYFYFDEGFIEVDVDGDKIPLDLNELVNVSFVLYKEPSVPQGNPEVVVLEEWLVMDLQNNLRFVVKTPDIEDYCKVYSLCKGVLLSKSEVTLNDSK